MLPIAYFFRIGGVLDFSTLTFFLLTVPPVSSPAGRQRRFFFSLWSFVALLILPFPSFLLFSPTND